MGVEIRESPVSDEEFAEMKGFVHDYLAASVESEQEGGRMRWYPWHSAEYRYNHILNVTELASDIAEQEGANVDVTRVAALFHDIAKLEADQDVHAEAGAHVAREYLESRTDYPESFIEQVCEAVADHSYEGDLEDVPLETRCLMEADLLDKVGANGHRPPAHQARPVVQGVARGRGRGDGPRAPAGVRRLTQATNPA